tara:strand:- start:126 stop:449 length:324 start_codon:yes stop_codon:yes gene_type:complete
MTTTLQQFRHIYNPNEDKLMDEYLIEIEGMNTNNPEIHYRYKTNITDEILIKIHPKLLDNCYSVKYHQGYTAVIFWKAHYLWCNSGAVYHTPSTMAHLDKKARLVKR